MIDLHRILVPTDFSKFSENALLYGIAFAEKFAAELHLIHVVQDLALFVPDAVTVPPIVVPPMAEMATSVRLALDRLIQEHNLTRLSVKAEVREGSPYFEIVRYAKETNIDLIVMGTHGRGVLAHVLMGSVTEKVVRKAPCPVLTVRHPEHEFVHP